MKVNSSQFKPVNPFFNPLFTYGRNIPVLDLTAENIALLYKYSDKKPKFLAQRNLIEITSSIFFTGGLLTAVFGFAKDFSKTLRLGIVATLAGGMSTAIGWFWKSSTQIREAIRKMDKNGEQSKTLEDFINSAINGAKKQLSFSFGTPLTTGNVVENDKEYQKWVQAFREKMIFNSTCLIEKTNPNRKDITVYYPGFGHDLPNILTGTDATTIICSSLERSLMNHDSLTTIVEIIKEMGGEINDKETFIPEDKNEGRAKIVFSLKSIEGKVKNRTLIYYYGKSADAIKFIPEELKSGYDVLWSEGAPIFTSKENTNIEAVKLINEDGIVVRGELQSVQIKSSAEFLKELENV